MGLPAPWPVFGSQWRVVKPEKRDGVAEMVLKLPPGKETKIIMENHQSLPCLMGKLIAMGMFNNKFHITRDERVQLLIICYTDW